MTLQKEIRSLRESIIKLQRSQDRWSDMSKNLSNNFGSTAPLTNGINDLISKMSSLVNPFQRVADAFTKADQTQKQMLAINTDLATFTEQNANNLNNLRGGFLENAEELFKNFSEGLRFSSDGMNALQNRMKLTGQNTEKLRQVTKSLFNATNGNVDSIEKLSRTNIELGRNYMVSNEKLLDALARNEEVLDFTSLFGMSEQTADQIMKLTGLMESKGISVKNQNQVVKLLTSSDQKSAQMRSLLGLGYDANERLLNGQDSVENLLKIGATFAERNLIQQEGLGKMMNTNNILQALGGDELKNTVIALTQTNKLLDKDQKGVQKFQSKEDMFYNTFENYNEESMKFYQEALVKYYPIISQTPEILRSMQAAQLGGMAGGLITDAFAGKLAARLTNIKSSKEQLLLANNAVKAAQAAASVASQAQQAAAQAALANARNAAAAAGAAVKTAVGGPLVRAATFMGRFAGPIGMIAGIGLPLLLENFDSIKSFFVGEKKDAVEKKDIDAKIAADTAKTAKSTEELAKASRKPQERPKTDINDLILKSLSVALNRRTTKTHEQEAMLNELRKVSDELKSMRSENRKSRIVGGG